MHSLNFLLLPFSCTGKRKKVKEKEDQKGGTATRKA
jgi:hypothetical protein